MNINPNEPSPKLQAQFWIVSLHETRSTDPKECEQLRAWILSHLARPGWTYTEPGKPEEKAKCLCCEIEPHTPATNFCWYCWHHCKGNLTDGITTRGPECPRLKAVEKPTICECCKINEATKISSGKHLCKTCFNFCPFLHGIPGSECPRLKAQSKDQGPNWVSDDLLKTKVRAAVEEERAACATIAGELGSYFGYQIRDKILERSKAKEEAAK